MSQDKDRPVLAAGERVRMLVCPFVKDVVVLHVNNTLDLGDGIVLEPSYRVKRDNSCLSEGEWAHRSQLFRPSETADLIRELKNCRDEIDYTIGEIQDAEEEAAERAK